MRKQATNKAAVLVNVALKPFSYLAHFQQIRTLLNRLTPAADEAAGEAQLGDTECST
jgi:hypothetical protein